MNIPGYESTYVLLCPLIKLGSLTPPKLINLYYLYNDLAIAFATDVLPIPGGPYNNIT